MTECIGCELNIFLQGKMLVLCILVASKEKGAFKN